MRVYPKEVEHKKHKRAVRAKEAPKALQIIAFVIAFASVYYFLIKLLFL